MRSSSGRIVDDVREKLRASDKMVLDGERSDVFVTPRGMKRRLEDLDHPVDDRDVCNKKYVDDGLALKLGAEDYDIPIGGEVGTHGKLISDNKWIVAKRGFVIGYSSEQSPELLLLGDPRLVLRQPSEVTNLASVAEASYVMGRTSAVNENTARANTHLIWVSNVIPDTPSWLILEADVVKMYGLLDTSLGGILLPNSSPPNDNYATRKKYVDDGLALKLDANAYSPVSAVQSAFTAKSITFPDLVGGDGGTKPANKQYVDTSVAGSLADAQAYVDSLLHDIPVPMNDSDAANKAYVDASDFYTVHNIETPLAPSDAANKGYVDNTVNTLQNYVNNGLSTKLNTSAYLPVTAVQAALTAKSLTVPNVMGGDIDTTPANKKYVDGALALAMDFTDYKTFVPKFSLTSTFNAIGDSWTYGLGVFLQSWCHQLAWRTSTTVNNMGVNGRTINYHNLNYIDEVMMTPAYAARSSIIFYGINDININSTLTTTNHGLYSRIWLAAILSCCLPQVRLLPKRRDLDQHSSIQRLGCLHCERW
jgi:hypothetical protein